jgi:hypothetical protein
MAPEWAFRGRFLNLQKAIGLALGMPARPVTPEKERSMMGISFPL